MQKRGSIDTGGCSMSTTSVSSSSPKASRCGATIVPAERSGMGASTLNASRELGGVLAVAILGAVINGKIVGELSARLAAMGVDQERDLHEGCSQDRFASDMLLLSSPSF